MTDSPDTLAKALVEAIREPAFVVGADLECRLANSGLYELFKEQPGAKIKVADFWPKASSFLGQKGEVSTEFNSSGSLYRVKLEASPLPNGLTLYRLLARTNIDNSIEQFHGQRLETLGILAGGVAHDFNNILAGILGHVTYLKNILPSSGEHLESLAAIEEGGRKASLLTQQILNFSRLDVDERPSPIDIGDVMLKTCTLLRGAISPEFSIEKNLPTNSIIGLCSEGKLAQILVNLVINARDALNSNGKISIDLSVTSDRELLNKVFNGADLSAPKFAVMRVKDNGCGMSEAVLARVFEPYFSTKKKRGTGLGLSTVRSIVAEFGGAIDIASVEGKGTCVEVYLPLVETQQDPQAKAASTNNSEQRMLKGSERILVIDDEDPVRNILRMSLEHLGYEVFVASSGQEAYDICRRAQAPFDLVVLDMIMPGEGGDQVFFKLREKYPQLKVLIISGYAPESVIRKILNSGGKGFLQKPFTIEDLSQRVRSSIEAKPEDLKHA